jgi:hypothetical protein
MTNRPTHLACGVSAPAARREEEASSFDAVAISVNSRLSWNFGAQVVSVGPMLQGLAKRVNDLSRGALVDDIVYRWR